jgi:hypothetical protein
MKTSSISFLSAMALGMLTTLALPAASTTVLEGFEESDPGMAPGTTTNGYTTNFCAFDGARGFCNTNIALFTAYGGRSAQGQVQLGQYTASGSGDPYVTEGTHSMAITFDASGYGNDFQVVLSDTNSYLVEQAAAAGQMGRYILRYDVVFPNPSQYVYFNQYVYIGQGQDYLSLGGAAPVYGYTNVALGVYSCALELPELGLPTPNSGTNVQLIFADDFGIPASATNTSWTIYIDNVRLVDTYASASTTPVAYPLISFKNGIGVATNLYPTVTSYYGNTVTARAHLALYTTNGLYNPATNGIPDVCTASNQLVYPHYIPSPFDTDFAVTESDGAALEVTNNCTTTADAGYKADFAVSFAGTKLAQILSQNLPPSQLAHYTLRWDTTMSEMWGFIDGTYINMTYATGAAALPMCQSRRDNWGQTGLQRHTYSATLDQIAAWGGSPVGADPAIIFFFDAQNISVPYIYFYDNFELIDTAPVLPQITSFHYNPTTHQFTLVWTSETGGSYTVQSSSNLQSGFTSLVAGIPSGGSTTTNTVTMPGGNTGYLRILAQ